MSIGKRIEQVRGKLSRRIFAESIGIVENTLRNYEQGLSLPNSDVIASICRKYNLATDWLVFGTVPGASEEIESSAEQQTTTTLEKQLCNLKMRVMELELKNDKLEMQLTFLANEKTLLLDMRDSQEKNLATYRLALERLTQQFQNLLAQRGTMDIDACTSIVGLECAQGNE